MCSGRSDWALPQPGFPIRRSTDQSSVDSSPWLIAATHVLHRHLAPRHPPLALHSLRFKDARARYAVLKGRGTPGGVGKRSRPPPHTGAELDVARGITRISRRDAET